MPGPGPDQPGQALPGGTPHAVPGVPGHPIVANPAQSSSEQFTWPTSVVCDNRVDGVARSQVGVPPRMSLYLIWQAPSKNIIRLGFFECSCHIGFLDNVYNGVELVRYDATGGERAVSLVYFLRSVFECVFTAYID